MKTSVQRSIPTHTAIQRKEEVGCQVGLLASLIPASIVREVLEDKISIRPSYSTCSLAVVEWEGMGLEGPTVCHLFVIRGLMSVFTFGGPGGFQARYGGAPRRRGPAMADEPTSPLMALLPMILLFAFAILTLLPNILSGGGSQDPRYSFEKTEDLSTQRSTWQRGINYWVNQPEWEASHIWQHVPETKRDENAASYSHKVRSFERGIENVYIRRLQNEVSCVPVLLKWY